MPGVAKLKYATLDRYDSEAREYTAHYVIDDVDPTEGGKSILNASGLPQLGNSYVAGADTDVASVVVSYSSVAPVNWNQSRTVWQAAVKYSSDQKKQKRPASSGSSDNPIDKPAIYSIAGITKRRSAYEIRGFETNVAGVELKNKTGIFPFPDAEVQVDDSNLVLRITKNYAILDFFKLNYYTNAVNSNNWMMMPARCWKMDPPQGRLVYWGETPYWEASFSFQGHAENWDLKPKSLSVLDINADPPENPTGTYLTGYWPVDDAGEFTFIDTNTHDGKVAGFDPFQWYTEVDFTSLGLPTVPPATISGLTL